MAYILNLIGAIAVGIGMYQITDSVLMAIVAVIVLNGAPWFAMFHNIWYVAFEFYKLGHLTIYGYIALAVYILIWVVGIVESRFNKNIEV